MVTSTGMVTWSSLIFTSWIYICLSVGLLEASVSTVRSTTMEPRFFPSSSSCFKSNYWVHDDEIFKNKILERYATFSSSKEECMAKIPFHLHFIWLGSTLPTVYESVVIESWKAKHQHWQVTMWDDAVASKFMAGCRSEAAFNAATNFGMKSDILRYEILYHHGGCYVDTDYECIQCLDDILRLSTSCFMGVSNANALEINNGLIGAVAKHPLINELIDTITHNHRTRPIPTTTHSATFLSKSTVGAEKLPSLFSSFLSVEENDAVTTALSKNNNNKDYMHTISSTGPGLLTRAVYDGLIRTEPDTSSELTQSVLILPYYAFTPVPNTVSVDIADVEARTALKEQYIIHPTVDNSKNHTVTKDSKGIDTDSSGFALESNATRTELSTGSSSIDDYSLCSRTYAIHWWQRSWQT